MLKKAVFGAGTTRAADTEEMKEFTAAVVPYTMMKEKRPAAPKDKE